MVTRIFLQKMLLSGVFIGLIAGFPAQEVAAQLQQATTAEPPSGNFFDRLQQQQWFFGNWNGFRSDLLDDGFEVEAVYTSETIANIQGGQRQGTAFLGNIDLTLSVDADALFGWQGSTFFFYALGNHGGSASDLIGDVQGASNIEAYGTFKLYEAWWEQHLADDRLALKAGLLDLNADFDVIETAGLFLNGSHGIGPDFSQSGLNGPSIFPNTSLGIRLALQPTPSFLLQAGAYDGVAGNPDQPHGTQIHLDKEDGLLLAGEMAWLRSGEDTPYGKLAVGAWYYTRPVYEHASGEAIASTHNRGFYLLSEQTIWPEKADPSQGLALYGRIGVATNEINAFGRYVGGGLVYTGILPQRDADQLGFAVAVVFAGDRFLEFLRESEPGAPAHEIAFEWTYQAQATPWLVVRPDIQYILHPGFSGNLSNALVLGLRTNISF